MEDFIYNQLKIFKELSMGMIDAVNFGDTDLMLDLLEQRQMVLNELEGCDKDLFSKYSRELEIVKIESLLETLMKNKINDIHENIKNLSKERKTIYAYNNNDYKLNSNFVYEV